MLRISLLVMTLLACGKKDAADVPNKDPATKPMEAATEKAAPKTAPNAAVGELGKLVDELCACADLKCLGGAERKLFAAAQKASLKGLAKPDADQLATIATKAEGCEKKLLTVGEPNCDAEAAKAVCVGVAELTKASEFDAAQISKYSDMRGSTFELFALAQQMKKVGAGNSDDPLKADTCNGHSDGCIRDLQKK